jgi:predicted Zn-dependent protease
VPTTEPTATLPLSALRLPPSLRRGALPLLLGLLALAGCATNPVTGKSEIQMVSEATEIQIGQQQYAPSRQAQGGDYVTDPAVVAYVRSVGNRLAAVSDRRLPYEFTVVNDSSLNAWALPGGKIAVNRGLLTELKNEAELAAVLGHEIVHAAARHGAQQMEKSQWLQIGAAAASIGAAIYGGQELGQMVGQGATVGAAALQARYGRADELEADQYGMKYMKLAGYDLQAAVALQELFVRKYAAEQRSGGLDSLFASHPPSQERVAANRATMTQKGGPGGDLGAERYQQAIARLKRAAPAYAKYDDAQKAAATKDLARARTLVNEAIRLEPRESRFHGLLGDLDLAAKNPKAALVNFEKARALDPGYFKPQVQTGIAQYMLGNRAAAEPTLQRSMELLPNAPGAYYLGRVYEDKGNSAEAVKYYKMAAGSKSSFSQDAMARLARLDLAQNPAAYLSIQPQLDNQGRIWLTIGNRTTVPIRDVSLQVAVMDPQSGRPYQGPVRVGTGSSVIAPGKAVNLQTSLGPFNSGNVLNQVKWQVESARPTQ